MTSFAEHTGFAQALVLIALFSGIPLAVSMAVGLAVSVLQAATQIQEQTLTYVPKILTVSVVLFVLAPWMGSELESLLRGILDSIPLLDVRILH